MASACAEWNPEFTAEGKAGAESKATTLTWSGVPGECDSSGGVDPHWDGTALIRVAFNEGGTKPSDPAHGDGHVDLASSATTWTHFSHRSDKEYTYVIFACEDTSCDSWWGGGTYVGSDEDIYTHSDWMSHTTEPEKWVLVNVDGPTDVGEAIVPGPWSAVEDEPNAPHIFFFPSDWGAGRSNKMAIYYSTPARNGQDSRIYFMVAETMGWPLVATWRSVVNDPSGWSDPTIVAEGRYDAHTDDNEADHPWAMLTKNNTDKRVQLFMQSQCRDEPPHHKRVVQIESTDEYGDNFNLGCDTSGCSQDILESGYGTIAIDANEDAATLYMKHVQHSRVMWNYIANPYVIAGADTPEMMVQIRRPSSGSHCVDTTGDDLGRAVGQWGGSVWEWEVNADPVDTECPEIEVEQAHDNTSIPLPNGEFKMYYKSWDDNEIKVVYWDGSQWEDTATVEFYWDDEAFSTGPSYECIDNVSAVVKTGSGGPWEGMTFKLDDSLTCETSGGPYSGFDDDYGDDPGDDAGIVFAELSS